MSTPLEIYREWERTGSRTTVHVMQIERGDGSAANRLTLTDKPYYDKGVAGTKYHQTYPAPIQAIISDIVTGERFDGTTFDDVILTNGDNGQFNDVLTAANMLGHDFTILRGDQSWSILSEDYPEKFEVICRGRVDQVVFGDRGHIRLKLVPMRHQIDNNVSTVEAPLIMGAPDNVPAVLEDGVNHYYRFNSSLTQSILASGQEVRDNGAPLSYAAVGATDYSEVLESGEFLGLVALTASPAGKVTGSIYSMHTSYLGVAKNFIAEHVISDYSLLTGSRDLSAYQNPADICWSPDGTYLYYLTYSGPDASILQRFTVTGGDISASISVASWDYETFLKAIDPSWITTIAASVGIDDTGETLFILTDNGNLISIGLDTAWLPSSANASNTTRKNLGSSTFECFKFSSDFLTIMIGNSNGVVGEYALGTAKDVSTINMTAVAELDLSNYGGVVSVDMDPDERYLYTAHENSKTINQITLINLGSLTDALHSRRSYYEIEASAAGFKVFPTDASTFYIVGSSIITQGAFDTPGIFPFSIYEDNFGYDQADYVNNIGGLGMFYNSPTKAGAIMADLFGSVLCGYAVDRYGRILVTKRKDPDAYVLSGWETLYEISLADFFGDSGRHIMHRSTIPAIRKVTMQYGWNFAVQQESELAGTLTEAEKASYAREYSQLSEEVVLSGHIDPGEVVFRSFLTSAAQVETIAEEYLALYDENRFEFEWTTNLHWTTLLSDFGLGSIIEVGNDIRHPAFSVGDRVQVIGRRINWSKHQQTLTVFK